MPSFIKQVGVVTFSFTAGFLVFMGAAVVYGQFTPPPTAPPGGNVPPPINTGTSFQAKSGTFGAADVWSDAFGDWLGALRAPKRYHLEMHSNGDTCEYFERVYENISCWGGGAQGADIGFLVGSQNSSRNELKRLPDDVYDFCADKDGCELLVARKNPNGVDMRGPGRLLIARDIGGAWKVKGITVEPGDEGSPSTDSGKDANGNAQTITGVGGVCVLTDAERIGAGGLRFDDAVQAGQAIGFHMKVTNASAVCVLDIKD